MADSKTVAWADVGEKHQSLNDRIYKALREAIFRGDYKPGERLTEPGLAKLFGVSRNPIREVLRKLQSEGIVEIPPRKSARVAVYSVEEIEEIIELRAELEGLSAQFAAGRLTDDTTADFKELLDAGNKAAEENDIAKLSQYNEEFHSLLSSSGKNRFLVDYISTLRERTLWLFDKVKGDRSIVSWKEHVGVLEAIMSSDRKLAALLNARHVRKIGDEVLKVMGEDNSAG